MILSYTFHVPNKYCSFCAFTGYAYVVAWYCLFSGFKISIYWLQEHDEWEVKNGSVYFQKAKESAPCKEIPSLQLINQTLSYARELERIVWKELCATAFLFSKITNHVFWFFNSCSMWNYKMNLTLYFGHVAGLFLDCSTLFFLLYYAKNHSSLVFTSIL
jgi:hypothetical protein